MNTLRYETFSPIKRTNRVKSEGQQRRIDMKQWREGKKRERDTQRNNKRFN